MKILLRYLLVFFVVWIESCAIGFSQTSINRGSKEFWVSIVSVGSPPHIVERDKAPGEDFGLRYDTVRLVIYSDFPSQVEVRIPRTGWKKSFNTKDSSAYIVTIPKDSIIPWRSGIAEDKGIYVSSENPITLTCSNLQGSQTDATLIYPIEFLGKEYLINHYHPLSFEDFTYHKAAFLVLLATEDGTWVDIETVPDDWGASRRVLLERGQTYLMHGQHDPTGTRITSNKLIALFSGGHNQNAYSPGIPGFRGRGGGNTIYEQLIPIEKWGQDYYSVPMDATLPGKKQPTWNRIIAAENNTKIQINGRQTTLQRGKWFDTLSVTALGIHADKPVNIIQIASGMGSVPIDNPTENDLGDGTFLQLLDQKKMLSGRTEFTTIPAFGAAYHPGYVDVNYITIIAPTKETSEIYLDEKNIGSRFQAFEFDSAMSYAQILVSKWKHEIRSMGRYHIYICGWGPAEAYSNGLGVGLGARKASMSYASPCVGESFELRGVAEKGAVAWHWDFADGTPEVQTSTLGTTSAGDDYTTITHSFLKAGIYAVRLRVLYDWNPEVEDTIWRNVIVPELPQPSLKADKPVLCFGGSTRLRAGTGFKTYTWSYNGELLATNPVTPHEQTVSKSGEYFVTVTDEKGCSNTATTTITVLPEIIAGITGSRESCINTTESYRADGIAANSTMTLGWTATGGTITAGQGTLSVSVRWTQQGVCQLKLDMRDETTGCFKDTMLTVNVGTGLNVAIGGKLVICEGTPTLLTAESGAGSDATFEWYFNGELLKEEKAQTLLAVQAGTYRVKVTSTTGCTGEATAEVTSAPLPQKPVVAGQPILCSDNSQTTLSLMNPQQYARYEWGFRNSIISDKSEITITQPGIYTLTVYNAEGCSAETTADVTQLALNVSQNTTICSGKPVELIAQATGSELLLYKWTPVIGLNNPNIANPIATPGETTTYTLEVSTHDRFCVRKDSVRIEVLKTPTIETIDISMCEGESAQFSVTSDEPNVTWSWTPTDGLSNPNIQNPTVTAFKSTTYFVTARNSAGCEITKQLNVTVTPKETITAVLQSDKAELEPGEATSVTMLLKADKTPITSFKAQITFDEKVFQFTNNSEKFVNPIDNSWRVKATKISQSEIELAASGQTALAVSEIALELTAYLAKQSSDKLVLKITELNGEVVKEGACRIITEESAIIHLKDVCAGDMRLVKVGEFQTLLKAVAPNPVTGETMEIQYGIGIEGNILLEIYNTQGELLQTVFKGMAKAGVFTEQIAAGEMPSGVYLLKLTTEQGVQTVSFVVQ